MTLLNYSIDLLIDAKLTLKPFMSTIIAQDFSLSKVETGLKSGKSPIKSIVNIIAGIAVLGCGAYSIACILNGAQQQKVVIIGLVGGIITLGIANLLF